MKKYVCILAVATLTTVWGCTEQAGDIPPFIDQPGPNRPTTPEKPEEPEEPEEPTYLFYEDFSGSEINAKRWKKCEWNTPNWAYFMGHLELDQFPVADGNVCLQTVDPLLYGGTLSKEEVEAGSLQKYAPWCMGIWTRGAFGFRYGEVQVRAKFGKIGDGAWPAIWLMPTDEQTVEWPGGGEIDIMERWDARNHIVHSTHYLGKSGATYQTKNVYQGGAEKLDLADYNVYGVRKTPGKLEYMVNGIITITVTQDQVESQGGKWPYEDHDYYILVNYACSATSNYFINNWSGNYLPSTEVLPYEMFVYYVTVTAI